MKRKENVWLIIGGTTESVEAVEYLQTKAAKVIVSAATAMGAEMYKNMPVTIWQGRLDQEGFSAKIREYHVDHILDASHPYAVEVTKIIKQICKERNLFYVRYTRTDETVDDPDVIEHVTGPWEAARLAEKQSGNIVLTTGVNTLEIYRDVLPDFQQRCYARVLDHASSIETCRKIFTHSDHWFAENPPFSVEDNQKLIRETKAAVLLSKDSGAAGGVPEKVEACKREKIKMILIDRPVEDRVLHTLDQLDEFFLNSGEQRWKNR